MVILRQTNGEKVIFKECYFAGIFTEILLNSAEAMNSDGLFAALPDKSGQL
jgi:hypothetical protein